MTDHRERLPSPERIRHELAALSLACARMADAYEEAYSYGLTPAGRGMVQTSGRGWSLGETNDPTASTVLSPDHARVRGATRRVARAIRRAGEEIDRSQAALMDAFLDTDPDLKSDRLAKRHAALQGVTDTDHRRTAPAGRSAMERPASNGDRAPIGSPVSHNGYSASSAARIIADALISVMDH